MMELGELKSRILKLLREDEEFRYAIVGLIGLEEIIRRLDRHDEMFIEVFRRFEEHDRKFNEILSRLGEHDEKFNEVLIRLDRHGEILVRYSEEMGKLREDMIVGFRRYDEEIRKLREDMLEGFKRHDEILEKHGEEIARLRQDMLEGFKRHDEEIKGLREEQARLRQDMLEGFKRHSEILEKHSEILERHGEILERHGEEIAKLREDMLEGFKIFDSRVSSLESAVSSLDSRVSSLESSISSLEKAMISGFGELGRFAGLTFEEFVRKFLTERLRGSGEIPIDAELRRSVVDGEEIDIFLEDPLIVGEATGYAESIDEITKLLRKAEIVKAKYLKEPRKILVVLSAKSEAARGMMRIAEEKGVELVIGKIVE
ncbi:MAG: hypothetical protein NZ955_04595 [Candidatus Bathyarchaeota archaeon]|nr:hypothetical protein [Candidatus Bathyarchaeota archaeon]